MTMSDYMLFAIYKKSGRFNGRADMCLLRGDDKMGDLCEKVNEYCKNENIQNVAVDIMAHINFALDEPFFDVAREFPRSKPKTFVTFCVKRIEENIEDTVKVKYGEIPF
jgi:hypothetical protein